MEKKMVNVRDMALYFDGSRLHFGEVQTNEDGARVFVNKEQNFAVWLDEENTNADFRLNRSSVMILREAIDGNAYGEDRNRGLENAGLDEMENQFINKLYELGTMEYKKFYNAVSILDQKISTRLRSLQAEGYFLKEYAHISELAGEGIAEQ